MLDLYTRLSKVGFDKEWLLAAVLPDWWEDELAAHPYNRAVAESAIAGNLGYRLADLRDSGSQLTAPDTSGVCFKRNPKVDIVKVAPAFQAARRAACIVACSAKDTPAFNGPMTAGEIRATLLADGEPVTLGRLVDFCWKVGIAVVGMVNLPGKAASFDGAAMFVGERPLAVLTSAKDGPPWLAFHLAHEMGHIFRGHVRPGSEVLVDTSILGRVTDDEELEANQFALELLTGSANGMQFLKSGLKAPEVGEAAAEFCKLRGNVIDPGIVVMAYCKSTDYWGVAKKALEVLGQASGGKAMITTALSHHIDLDLLTKSDARFLEAACGIAAEAVGTT